MSKVPIGVVGGRGYTGRELLRLLAGHPSFEVAFAVSKSVAGEPVSKHVDGYTGDLVFEDLSPSQVARKDVRGIVLALANGESPEYVDAIVNENHGVAMVDLSADHRFDDKWVYGLPERNRAKISGARHIANPGCYATGMQLVLDPILNQLRETPTVFGVSGYSGAGTTPSPRNNPEMLRDNLMPYSLIGHVHEREVTKQLGRDVRFLPHVAPFFRGISLTISVELSSCHSSVEALRALYTKRYAKERLVVIQDDAPLVRDAVGTHEVRIGGFTLAPDGKHAVIVATLDNLLKGAATQAIQNLNLSIGAAEYAGIV